MFEVTTVSSSNELHQIHSLNLVNLRQRLSDSEKSTEGFVTWLYSLELLEKMHQLAPSVIVKFENKVIGYALTTLQESSNFHADLDAMFLHLKHVLYQERSLYSYHYYCMGQICIDKKFRGQGIVNLLYQEHKRKYGQLYDFILTEISTNNPRSLKAHLKIGFVIIDTYTDDKDEWHVVVWNWESPSQ